MGLVLSLGTKTESTVGTLSYSRSWSQDLPFLQHKPVASSLVGFVQDLSPETGIYPQVNLVGDLVEQLKLNFSNNNIFIPLLQTFNVLLEGCALDSLNGNSRGENQ